MKFLTSLFVCMLLLSGGCAMLANPEEVVVTANGTPLREKQVVEETDKRLAAYIAREASKGMIYEKSSEKATRASMRDDVLHTLIERVLIADQLKADHIEITDADVDAYFIARVRDRFKTLEQAEQELKEQGKTREGIREQLRYQAMGVEALYNLHAKNKQEMTEADARRSYEDNLKEFILPEQRRVSHILIACDPHADAAVKKSARARAEKLLARVRAGEDFTALAKTYSEDTASKNRGGDRGWSDRGLVVDPNNDPFGEITFAMKTIGGVSDVIETVDGYHIARLTGIKKGRIKSFEESKWEIMEDFKVREIRGFWYDFGDTLWKKAKIEWSPKEKIRREKEEKRLQEFNRKMELEIQKAKELQEKTNVSK